MEIYHNREYKRANEINLENLKTILEDNKNTEFGLKYNFSQIQNYEQYKKAVPLTNYDTYDDYIERMFAGEKNILTAYDIVTYLRSSGTTKGERKKKIPVSSKALEKYEFDFDHNRKNIIRDYRKKNKDAKRLSIKVYRVSPEESYDKCTLGSELVYHDLYVKGQMIDDEYAGGLDLLFDKDIEDVYYVKIWVGFLEENIGLLEFGYMSDAIRFFSYMSENYKEIINNILSHTIPDDKKITKKAKTILLKMPINQERLDYVKNVCDKGFDLIVKKLWPNCQCISGSFSRNSIYEIQALDKYCGDIPRDAYMFAMSESYLGHSAKLNSFDYAFAIASTFYELIPFDESNNNGYENAILLAEAEEGKLYELVLTTFSGFYRYRTYDIIKITGKIENNFTYEYFCRNVIMLNIKNEQYTLLQLERVIKKVNQLIPNIIQYTFGATIENELGRYYLLLAINDDNNLDINDLNNKFDEILCEVNKLYEQKRKLEFTTPKIVLMDVAKYESITNFEEKKLTKQVIILQKTRLDECIKNKLI